jgi:ribosomal RNA-processing protein 7
LWQVELDAAVQEYDARRAEELQAREEQAATVDADGFTIVRKTKKGLQKSGGANVRAYVARRVPRRRKRSGCSKTFYAFQVNQRRDNELETLKRKFDEDRERLKRIRANRVFNPK